MPFFRLPSSFKSTAGEEMVTAGMSAQARKAGDNDNSAGSPHALLVRFVSPSHVGREAGGIAN